MSFIIVKYALSSGVFLVTPQEYSITPYPDSERLTFRKATSLFIGHYYNYGVDSKGDFKSNDYFENTPEGRNKAFAYINHLELKKINSIRKQFTQALPAGLSLKAADEARDFISSLQD
jgi:hypothetical protein